MNDFIRKIPVLLSLGVLMQAAAIYSRNAKLGLFEAHSDIGEVLKPGAVEYDAIRKSYTIAGGGENMWFGTDAFHFVKM